MHKHTHDHTHNRRKGHTRREGFYTFIHDHTHSHYMTNNTDLGAEGHIYEIRRHRHRHPYERRRIAHHLRRLRATLRRKATGGTLT